MRVVYLADESAPNGYYRGYAPMTVLSAARGVTTRRLGDEEMRCPRGVDVLLIHRYCEVRALGLARDAKAQGVAVVWDDDDHLGAMPKSAVTYKRFGGFAWERRRADIQRVFACTDVVTTPSAALAQHFGEIGAPRTAVIENYVADDFLNPDHRPRSGITIGWIAGLEHQIDVERVPVVAALQRLLDERPDVHVVTVGLRLGLRSDRYRAIRKVPRRELVQQAAAFDVAIAPLADVAFSRSRSNVKLKEYAAAGVPWLASPVGPYAGMGRKQGGCLVEEDRWYEQLAWLCEKPRERRKLARAAAKWAQGQTLSKNVHRWEETFREAIAHARATC